MLSRVTDDLESVRATEDTEGPSCQDVFVSKGHRCWTLRVFSLDAANSGDSRSGSVNAGHSICKMESGRSRVNQPVVCGTQ